MTLPKKFLTSTVAFHSTTRASVPLSFTEYSQNSNNIPPLVIVHGLFGQKQNFDSIAKALHKQLTAPVFAVDARNHGSSPHTSSMAYQEMAEDLIEFLDKVQVPRVNLLGHSMGGKIVMKLAMEHSDRVNRLIVEDSSPLGYPQGVPFFRKMVGNMRKVDLKRPRKEVRKDLEIAIPDKATRQFILTNLESEGKEEIRWKCNLDAIYNYVDKVLGHPLPDGSFQKPTLFIMGGNSDYVPDGHREDIKRRFPKVQFETIPGAGHVIHAEKPQPFIDSVCEGVTWNSWHPHFTKPCRLVQSRKRILIYFSIVVYCSKYSHGVWLEVDWLLMKREEEMSQ